MFLDEGREITKFNKNVQNFMTLTRYLRRMRLKNKKRHFYKAEINVNMLKNNNNR